jgi:hypothetical protein
MSPNTQDDVAAINAMCSTIDNHTFESLKWV